MPSSGPDIPQDTVWSRESNDSVSLAANEQCTWVIHSLLFCPNHARNMPRRRESREASAPAWILFGLHFPPTIYSFSWVDDKKIYTSSTKYFTFCFTHSELQIAVDHMILIKLYWSTTAFPKEILRKEQAVALLQWPIISKGNYSEWLPCTSFTVYLHPAYSHFTELHCCCW